MNSPTKYTRGLVANVKAWLASLDKQEQIDASIVHALRYGSQKVEGELEHHENLIKLVQQELETQYGLLGRATMEFDKAKEICYQEMWAVIAQNHKDAVNRLEAILHG